MAAYAKRKGDRRPYLCTISLYELIARGCVLPREVDVVFG